MFYVLESVVYRKYVHKWDATKEYFFLHNSNKHVLQWLIIGFHWDLVMIIYKLREKCIIDSDNADCAEKA